LNICIFYLFLQRLCHITAVPKCYRIVPKEFRRLVQYVNNLKYADEPDYTYMSHSLRSIAKENNIDMEKKLDWIGRTSKEKMPSDDDDLSSDNRNTGSSDSDSQETARRKKRSPVQANRKKSITTQKSVTKVKSISYA
ncbi:hypothetical protein COOONC_04695, partial [Cooperia oncophora]